MHQRSEAPGTVVVTGGAGFIGSHLCDALLTRGARVTCVDNLVGTDGSPRNVVHLLAHERFELLREDVVEWARHADLATTDCVFHQAASKNTVCREDPERDLDVNARGTLRLLLAAARDGVGRFVHASTGSVFGETDAVHGDGTPRDPVSFYGTSKLAAEAYCRVVGEEHGLDYTVLRYYHVIGRRQNDSDTGGVVPIFVRRALDGRPLVIFGDGEQTRSFTAVGDVVAANLLAATSPLLRRRALTCASGIRVSIRELAEHVIERTGSTAGIRHEPARPGDIRHFDVRPPDAAWLGMRFDTDWRAAVDDVIAWMAAERTVA